MSAQKIKTQKKIMTRRSQKWKRLGLTKIPMRPTRMKIIMKECSKLKAKKLLNKQVWKMKRQKKLMTKMSQQWKMLMMMWK